MTNADKRLDRLSLVWKSPDAVPNKPRYDYSCLTPQQQYELDQLLRWDEPHNAGDRPNRAMTAEEDRRLTELLARVTYRPSHSPVKG